MSWTGPSTPLPRPHDRPFPLCFPPFAKTPFAPQPGLALDPFASTPLRLDTVQTGPIHTPFRSRSRSRRCRPPNQDLASTVCGDLLAVLPDALGRLCTISTPDAQTDRSADPPLSPLCRARETRVSLSRHRSGTVCACSTNGRRKPKKSPFFLVQSRKQDLRASRSSLRSLQAHLVSLSAEDPAPGRLTVRKSTSCQRPENRARTFHR